jgi:hypothetical protein
MAQGNQAGIGSSSVLPDHGHVAAGDGGQINPETGLNPQPKVDFGDGSDGNVTFPNAVSVIARDMCFDNVIAVAGAQVCLNGFTVKIRGKLSVLAGATVWSQDNVNMAGQPGAAGVGGAGGFAAFVLRRIEACLPSAGGAGGNGGGSGVTPEVGGGILDPVFFNAQTLFEGWLWAGSGGGGGGGLGVAPTQGGVPLRLLGGAKGGAGATAVRTAGNHDKGGGGGGGGGGKIEIWANEVDNAGIISAIGGNGGAGEEVAGGSAGGGGGGGGGAILIFYKTVSGSGLGVRNVGGGAGGGTLNPGAAGVAGYSYAMKIGA